MSFDNAVGLIPQTSRHFAQDPFMVGANAFVPLNRQLSYDKNLMGIWADADTYWSKVNAANSINNYKVLENNINSRKAMGLDEAVAAQFSAATNPDGTFRPVEEAAGDAYKISSNPYARAALFDIAQKGAQNTASREAWLNPENSIHAQQGYGILPRGVQVRQMNDGRFQVSDGTKVFGVFTQPEMSMILSGVGNANKVGAVQTSFGDFEKRAETRHNYDVKLAELKHDWDMSIANASAQGKAASALAENSVKAIEGFQKFVTDNGLLAEAVSGNPQALQQLKGYASYTENTYGLPSGTISRIFFSEDKGPVVNVDVGKVGAAFNHSGNQQSNPWSNLFGGE